MARAEERARGNMARSQDKPTESKEMKRVKKLIKFMDEYHQPIAQNLFIQLVFIDNTLNELAAKVETDGALDVFEQGAQSMIRESPALTAYNKTIQRYNQMVKQFIDLLPVGSAKTDKDALLNFIEGGKD